MQQPNFMSRGNGPPVPPATSSGSGAGGPPITKKQRGGQTPISIRQQRPSSRGRTRIPPPTTGVGVGLGSGGGTPGGAGDVGAVIDEGITRRRAELQRLQEKSQRQRHAMNNRSSPREASSATVSATAAPPLSTTTALSSQPPVPPIPIRPAAVAPLRHTSDLFPSVPKSPSVKKETVQEEESAQIAAFANASTFNKGSNHDGKKKGAEAEGGVGPPLMSMSTLTGTGTSIPAFQSTTSTTKSSVNPNPNLPPPTPSVGNLFSPTPAAVGRRLEFPSSIKSPSASTSPKKEPPLRPPPSSSSALGPTLPLIRGGGAPPPSIRRTTQGPPTPLRKTTPTIRSRSKSPVPTSASSKATTTRTTAAAAAPDSVFEMRRRMNRAKSAPPARPPLPSGPPPPPPHGSSSSSPAARAWAQKKVKARSKARSRSSGRNTNRPKPVIVSPGSLHLEGAKETTTKDAATTKSTSTAIATATATTKKFASGIPPPSRSPIRELVTNKSNDNTKNVVGGNGGIGMGVMDTSITSAPITTTTSTTPTTFLQSNHKSMYNDDDDEDEDGQKTPPSTGSSARRQKLQLMREQAGAVGAIATAVDVIGAGPLATAVFTAAAAGSLPVVTAAFAAATDAVSNSSNTTSSTSGPPATAAFAAAISGATTTTNNIASGPPPSKTLTATTTATATAGLPPPGNKLSDALPPPGRVAGSSSAADLPLTTTGSLRNESQIRLEEVYAKSERDKTAAFLKVKELELQLTTKINEEFERAVQQKQQRHTPVAPVAAAAALDEGGVNLEELVQLAETQGPEAALLWVKQQQPHQQQQLVDIGSPKLSTFSSSGGGSNSAGSSMGVGFTSPPPTTHHDTMTPTTSRRRIASRALTPHPIRHQNNNSDGDKHNAQTSPDMETPEEVERRLIQQFREAAKYVPYEFSSELANFTIRRPYGMDQEQDPSTNNNTVQLFEFVKPPDEPFEAYARRAHVSSKSSIEVVAVVKADNSPFLLFNTAGVRYKTNPYSTDEPFVHIENVDLDVDRPLGHITYMDAQTGREREYSLDEMLEEALLIREQYCGTVTSTALGFDRLREDDGPSAVQQQQQHPVQEVQIPGRDLDLQKAPSKDVGVETDEQGMMGPDGTSSPPEQQEAAAEDDDAGSSDVLVVFIGMMFSAFFKLLVGLVVGLPLRVVRSIIVWTISYLLIQYVLLYCANATGYHEWILAVNNDPVNPFQFHLTLNDFLAHTNRPGIM